MRKHILGLVNLGAVVITCLCVYVAGCQDKLVRSEKAGAAEGFVKDSMSLMPIVGADVFLDDDPYDPYPKTDSTGYYQVVTNLADWKTVKISIKAQGYQTQNKNIVIEANKTQRLDFLLVKEGE